MVIACAQGQVESMCKINEPVGAETVLTAADLPVRHQRVACGFPEFGHGR